jgi:hypothetical protein
MAMAMQLLSSAAAHDVPQHERATPARVVAPTPAVGCFPGASPMPNSNGAWRQSIGGGRHPNGGRAPCATLDLNALINAADSIKTPRTCSALAPDRARAPSTSWHRDPEPSRRRRSSRPTVARGSLLARSDARARRDPFARLLA